MPHASRHARRGAVAAVAVAALLTGCGSADAPAPIETGAGAAEAASSTTAARAAETGARIGIVFAEDQALTDPAKAEGPVESDAAEVTSADRAVLAAIARASKEGFAVESVTAQQFGPAHVVTAELVGSGQRVNLTLSQRTSDFVLPMGAKDLVESGEVELATKSGVQVAFRTEGHGKSDAVRRVSFVTVDARGQVIEAVVRPDLAVAKPGTSPAFTLDDAVALATAAAG